MKKKVMIVFGSGGHQRQMTILAASLREKYNISAVFTPEDFVAEPLKAYRHYYVKRPRIADEGYIAYAVKLTISFFQGLKVVLQERPSAIISCGPSTALPVFLAGKLGGAKLIFIESWSKITTRSITGKLVYPLTDIFLVQWKELLPLYKKAVYRGRFHG